MTCGLLGVAPAWSFLFPTPVKVVEFKHLALNHYFLTAFPQEMAAIDAGAAGPGWVRTGFTFLAYRFPREPGALYGNWKQVSRFHGTPGLGPNSHFYTADASEADGLKRPGSGWTLEGVAFEIAVPDAGGQCSHFTTPVYRLYNNRWMFNDSNHRYVATQELRERMVAEGWIDEGVRFCTPAAGLEPFKTYEVSIPLDTRILPSSQCEDESINIGGCLAINNLPVPIRILEPLSDTDYQLFTDSTGYLSPGQIYVLADEPAVAASQRVFAQGGSTEWGIHLDTRDKGPSPYSSVNPLYQFRTSTAPGSPDLRFFPWIAASPFETQLSITAYLDLRRVNTRGASSYAYGHPTVEFIDQRSGRHLYFTVLAYATMAGGDFVAPDVTTGKVIVGTTFRDNSPFGRSFGERTSHVASGLAVPAGAGGGPGGKYEFRMDRTEFQRVLDAARMADAALSGDPRDYLVDNFHFTNEVVGEGEIGLSLGGLQLRVLPR